MEFLSPDDNKQEQDSEKAENLDAKVVFQDTKKSLETLKQNIFSQTDELKKKEQEQHLSKYIDHLLWFSVLSQHDKKLLNQLKQNLLAKTSLQETDLESVITIVSHLEQKAETLDEIDQERVKELQTTLSQHKASLDILKKGVAAVAPTLEEAKKKAFETMKKDLEKHRWSSWLAQPVYDYLMDKHVHKKSVSKFKEWLIGTVGLTVVGWFVGKDLKNLISNIDNLKVEDIIEKTEDKIDELGKTVTDWTDKEIEIYHNKMENSLFNFFEKKFGKKFDKDKFKKTFEEWSKERDPKTYIKQTTEDIKNARQWEWSFDTLWEIFSLVVMPAKSIFDLLIRMKNEWLISWKDIIVDWVLMPSWKAVLNVGIWSVWLFANTMKTVFASMSVEELTEYIKEHNEKLDVESKMALWWLLYRRGWWFWNLAGHVGNLAGEWLSLLFTQRTWGDIWKISAYLQWGVMGNIQKEIKVFDQLEKSLVWTGVFKEIKTISWASVLDDIMGTMKKNLMIFDIMQNNKTFSSIESALQKQWLDDVVKEFKNSIHWWKDVSKINTVAGNIIETSMNKSLIIAEDSFGTWKKLFGKHMKFPWSKFPYEMDLITKMRDFSKLQGKMLQSDAIFNDVKNLYRNFSKGKKLVWLVEYGDEVKFALNNVDDAKKFFDNIRTIWRHSPEILKTLFKWFPLIMMGREVMDKLSDENNKDTTMDVIKDWLFYLTPIVGPIKLIQEWITIENWSFKSLTSAGIGIWLVTVDSFFFVKAATKGGISGAVKFMTSPVLDSISFMKSVGKWTYMTFKMMADGIRVIKAGETAKLWVEALKFLKWSWLKLAWITLLCYLWYVWLNELFDWPSKEEKEQLAKIQWLNKEELEAQIEKDWRNLDDNQKAALIKFATAQRMSINMDDVESKKSWNQISLRFKSLVNYNEMKEVEQDLQESLSRLEATKDINLHYSLDWWEVKYQLLAIKEKQYIDESWIFKEQEMKSYLLAMGYPENIATDLMKKIS